ncbi:MAG TPA: LLM class flavin-dependent oxidoreductase [Acidimicrobiales bacterium]|nr:LLM class flavin-dependent oxidoreductase [Acidimicrobiales bacterium]
MELWSTRTPEVRTAEGQAERAELAGWDGITFTDSQNLVGDPFVAVALASRVTERLRFATAVTNLATRHPAALANVAVTVQEESGGRFLLGVGRGDTALFHLGRTPMPVAPFGERLQELQTYLRGGSVELNGFASRLRWLDRTREAKVPLDVAASGPKVIDLAARVADRITFAVGADPDRLAWAIELARSAVADAGREPGAVAFGAYVNIGCHPDAETARSLIAGGVAAFAHFSSMPGSTGAGLAERDKAVVAEVGHRYDSHQHLRNDAAHTDVLEPDFVDRFAVVGKPDRCVERLEGLARLGLDRFVLTGPTFGGDREASRLADRLVRTEVLPALREAAPA